MAKIGMNMERIKKENRSLILSYINDVGPVSRKDIALNTGLTAASVTQITTVLLAKGLLKELGTVSAPTGTAGRKKVLLDINENADFVYSVNIESEETNVAVCNLKGEAVALTRFPTNKEVSPEAFLRTVAHTCLSLKADLSKEIADKISCVSVGIPGLVDTDKGVSLHAYGIWDEEVDVAGLLGNSLNLPVMLENNVDAFATAELLFGIGRTQDILLLIKWGPGVGSTIVINNNVYKGRHGKTAELGHYIVDKNGLKCSCGRTGCLETKLSYSALKQIVEFSPDTFGMAYESSSPDIRARIDEAIDLFARSIVNTGTILAPNRFVLSGSLFRSNLIREKLINACKAYDPAYHEKRILYTTLSDRESYIGPAAVYTWHLLFPT